MSAADPTAQALEQLHAAAALLRQGRPQEAGRLLLTLAAREPNVPDVRRLLGVALLEAGDASAAEMSLRAALALDPRHKPAILPLADALILSGKHEQALALLEPWIAEAPDEALVSAQAQAFKAAGRKAETIAAYRRAVELSPASGVAEHNLAASLGDAEAHGEAEASARRAMAKGTDAPQTWLVLARALSEQGRLDEAETAYNESLKRDPLGAEAHCELAQLVWMRTEDVGAATANLDEGLTRSPDDLNLTVYKARLLDQTGDTAGAYALVEDVLTRRDDGGLRNLAAQLASHFDPPAALRHATRAYALWPHDNVVVATMALARLAAGDGAGAARAAQELATRAPLDQHAHALLASAWRMMGDPRYERLYDYASTVHAWTLDTPDGWRDLPSYLSDLAETLNRLHAYRTHPIGQSLRHGSQKNLNLDRSDDPVVRAFRQAVDGPIRRHLERLGAGNDRLRSRQLGGYRFAGMWSVRLRPHGFHIDHVHPAGWLSSACYIDLPQAVNNGREGWIRFGRPGVATAPAFEAEHWVKPEPGMLVLFPSYMWHGVETFGGDAPRLTIAFDLLPAPPEGA